MYNHFSSSEEYYNLCYGNRGGEELSKKQAESSMKSFTRLYNFLIAYSREAYWTYEIHQMEDWLKSNCEGRWFKPKDVRRKMSNYWYEIDFSFICFENESDAMAFKLAWS